LILYVTILGEVLGTATSKNNKLGVACGLQCTIDMKTNTNILRSVKIRIDGQHTGSMSMSLESIKRYVCRGFLLSEDIYGNLTLSR
jgi:hypothetical protein